MQIPGRLHRCAACSGAKLPTPLIAAEGSMNTSSTAFGAFSLLFNLLLLDAQSPEVGLTIEVDIYNYSSISREALAGIEQETARIFRRLRVAMKWRYCPLSAEQRIQNTACDHPQTPTRFTLRLLSTEMTRKLNLSDDVYGFAKVPDDGTFGTVANVFADRALQLAKDEESRRVLLGHFIAHELGHLLLADGGHPARAGIMHVPWLTEEVEQAKRGALLFLPEQAKKIRAQVVARTIPGVSFSNGHVPTVQQSGSVS